MLKKIFGSQPAARNNNENEHSNVIGDEIMSKTLEPTAASTIKQQDDNVTKLEEGTVLVGDLEVRGKLYIAGTLQGKVRCDDLVYIAESGVVNGEVLAMDVKIAGYFEGAIECGVLTIDSSGRVTGDAAADTFVIVSGGQFQGESRKRSADNVTQLIRSSNQPQRQTSAIKDS